MSEYPKFPKLGKNARMVQNTGIELIYQSWAKEFVAQLEAVQKEWKKHFGSDAVIPVKDVLETFKEK